MTGKTAFTAVVIRDFYPADAEDVSALFKQIYGDHYVYPEVYLPSLICERNANGAWRSAVAELDGKIVAHAALLIDQSAPDCAEIALTVASQSVVGRGVGVRVCRYLRDRAPQFGVDMLTALLVTSHIQSQRMANPLGFSTTGLLFDYLPSPFSAGTRESYVISCLPLVAWPLPEITWPPGCRHWIAPMVARYGIDRRPVQNDDAEPPPPLNVQSDGELIKLTLRDVSERTLEEVCDLPSQRRKLIRVSLADNLAPNLPSAWKRLSKAGYRHTGIMPISAGGWHWLMQSGPDKEQLPLHCSLARHIFEASNLQQSLAS